VLIYSVTWVLCANCCVRSRETFCFLPMLISFYVWHIPPYCIDFQISRLLKFLVGLLPKLVCFGDFSATLWRCLEGFLTTRSEYRAPGPPSAGPVFMVLLIIVSLSRGAPLTLVLFLYGHDFISQPLWCYYMTSTLTIFRIILYTLVYFQVL
jgi:hypothetical protein